MSVSDIGRAKTDVGSSPAGTDVGTDMGPLLSTSVAMSVHSLATSAPIRCLAMCTDVRIGLTDVASKMCIYRALSRTLNGPGLDTLLGLGLATGNHIL